MDSLSSDTGDDGRSLMNTYYVEVRDSEYKSTGAGSVPMLRDGVVSEPSLPADGSIDGVTLGQPFTTRAVVHITTSRTPDHSIMQAAQSPWRVVALPWNEKTRTGQVKDSGVVFIGLSLSGVAAVGMTYLSEEIHPSFVAFSMGLYISGNSIGGMSGRLLTGGLYRFLRLARGAGGDQRLCAGRGDYVLAYPARVAPFPPDLAATENAAD